MSDRVVLSRLAVYAHHGVHAEEERLGQRFYISVSCALDLAPAGRADDHARSVCYATLATRVHDLATARRFRSIEGLAEAIASDTLAAFPAVETVQVRVEKPGAPVPFILDTVAVEISRGRRG